MRNAKYREDARAIQEKEFTAFYNSRDLILYALSVGFGLKGKRDKGKTQEDDIKYLYEQHPDFMAVPAFCLALSFWANQNRKDATSYSIPPFPPPSMTATVTIPTRYINSKINRDISAYPILHMWQSIQWHRDLPVPVVPSSTIETRMICKILTISPKKIGTFVTSETEIHEVKSSRSRGSLLCTLQSTALVLGIPQEIVIPVDITQKGGSTNASSPKAKTVPVPSKGQRPDFEWTYETTPTQSLLYRLASGDSNRIHVLGDAILSQKLKLGGKQRPILHGLCTFGVATRAILQFAASDTATRQAASSLVRLEGRFSKPVFIGDTLLVKVWEMSHLNRALDNTVGRVVAFRVLNLTTGEVAVDNGYAELSKDRHVKVPGHLSRL